MNRWMESKCINCCSSYYMTDMNTTHGLCLLCLNAKTMKKCVSCNQLRLIEYNERCSICNTNTLKKKCLKCNTMDYVLDYNHVCHRCLINKEDMGNESHIIKKCRECYETHIIYCNELCMSCYLTLCYKRMI